MKLGALIPLVLFILLVAVLAVGLTRDPSVVESPLVGKPLPQFMLPTLKDPAQVFSSTDLAGQVYLLNVWGSWCIACRDEHPLLMQLAKRKTIPIYGFNYKDTRENALRWLAQFGDPYSRIAFDNDGRTAIDLGVYGAPETFLVDDGGIIVYKHVGPITAGVWQTELLPLINKLQVATP